MTQQNKKNNNNNSNSNNHPAAKLASNSANVAHKVVKDTMAAAESTRNSAENVVKMGGAAVSDMQAFGANEAQKIKDKALEIGRESAEKLAKSADKVSKAMSELVELSRYNMEAAVECGNLTASLARDISSEVFEYTNNAFSENLEMSKDVFACRTISDMVDLQSRIVKNAIGGFLGETSKLNDMLFEYGSEALEPINERMAQANEQFNKVIASNAV